MSRPKPLQNIGILSEGKCSNHISEALIRRRKETLRYIFVTGGMLSSVGKGSVTASIGKILQVMGYGATATKIDPLNFDSGTMNPYMHGEVFVMEDGGETNLYIGSYERMLDRSIGKDHSITTGQIYWDVIGRKRRGEFLGRCVPIIPHVTLDKRLGRERVDLGRRFSYASASTD